MKNYFIIIFALIFALIFAINFVKKTDKIYIDTEIIGPTCRKSTINNPMANLLPFSKDPELRACDESDTVIENNLFNGFMKDQDDNISREKMGSIYKLPDTSILGMEEEFGHFLFYGNSDESYFCKRDGIHCESYRDVRFSF